MLRSLYSFCPNPDMENNILENLLSATYTDGDKITAQTLAEKLYKSSKQHEVLKQVLYGSSLSVYKKAGMNNDHLVIKLLDNMNIATEHSFFNEYVKNTSGFYNDLLNLMVVKNEDKEVNLYNFYHELTHQLMQVLFNNKSHPYNSDTKKELFTSKIMKSLTLAKDFLNLNHKTKINFDNCNSTFEMGRKIAEVFSGLTFYIAQKDIKKLTEIYTPDSPKMIGFGETILETVTMLSGIDAAKELIEKGFYRGIEKLIKSDLLMQDFKLLSWLVDNKIKIPEDYCLDDTKYIIFNSSLPIPRDYLELQLTFYRNIDFLKLLFKHTPILDHKSLCFFKDIYKKYKFNDKEEYTKFLEECIKKSDEYHRIHDNWSDYLYYLLEDIGLISAKKCEVAQNDFLNLGQAEKGIQALIAPYLEGYKIESENPEIIVRLPQIIAEDLYEGPIVPILQPLLEYWEEVISEKIWNYNNQDSNLDICPSIEFGFNNFLLQ